MNKYKIKLIAVYLGSFPEYFSLWLKSCEQNNSIDFMVVTDQNEPKWYPSNVNFFKTNIEQLKKRFKRNFTFDIELNKPYKLCDFRPLYGIAFKDELKEYDFWGHCDIDLIWGDIRRFIKDELLDKYDRIGNTGHFSIYRNTDKMNYVWKLPGSIFNYIEVFTNDENYAFDEHLGINLICKQNNISYYKIDKIADTSYSRTRLRLGDNDYPHELFYWENGRCYRSYTYNNRVFTDEFMYVHFSKKKLSNLITEPHYTKSFWIRAEGFSEKKIGVPSSSEIIEMSNFRSHTFEKIEFLKYKIKKIVEIAKSSKKKQRIWIKQQIAFKKYY